jgi:hypothetical protein
VVRTIRIAILCLGVAAAGCGRSSVLSPTGNSATLAGRWSGTVVDQAFGSGQARIDATDSNGVSAGSFSLTFPDGEGNRQGSFNGYLIGTSVTAFMAPDTPIRCADGTTFTGTLTISGTLSGARLNGSYVGFGCGSVSTGTLDLARP